MQARVTPCQKLGLFPDFLQGAPPNDEELLKMKGAAVVERPLCLDLSRVNAGRFLRVPAELLRLALRALAELDVDDAGARELHQLIERMN